MAKGCLSQNGRIEMAFSALISLFFSRTEASKVIISIIHFDKRRLDERYTFMLLWLR